MTILISTYSRTSSISILDITIEFSTVFVLVFHKFFVKEYIKNVIFLLHNYFLLVLWSLYNLVLNSLFFIAIIIVYFIYLLTCI